MEFRPGSDALPTEATVDEVDANVRSASLMPRISFRLAARLAKSKVRFSQVEFQLLAHHISTVKQKEEKMTQLQARQDTARRKSSLSSLRSRKTSNASTTGQTEKGSDGEINDQVKTLQCRLRATAQALNQSEATRMQVFGLTVYQIIR